MHLLLVKVYYVLLILVIHLSLITSTLITLSWLIISNPIFLSSSWIFSGLSLYQGISKSYKPAKFVSLTTGW